MITPKTTFTIIGLFFIISILQLTMATSNNRTLENFKKETNQKLQTMSDQVDSLSPTSNDHINKAIADLREDMAKYRAEQMGRGQTLGLETTFKIKTLKLKDTWKSIDVFEDKLPSSKIIGQLTTSIEYSYLDNQSGWYQVALSGGLVGWVQSQFVYENN